MRNVIRVQQTIVRAEVVVCTHIINIFTQRESTNDAAIKCVCLRPANISTTTLHVDEEEISVNLQKITYRGGYSQSLQSTHSASCEGCSGNSGSEQRLRIFLINCKTNTKHARQLICIN